MAEEEKGREWIWAAGLLAAGVLLRGLLLVFPSLDSDVAVVGLMAMHFLRGEFTAFYWGQHYGGTLEPLLAAPLLALFGPTPRALNAAPALVSLVYVFFMYRLGRRLWGRRAGLAALACASLAPYYLLWFSTSARGLHAELLALGSLLLWLTLRLLELNPRDPAYRRLALALGLAAGVGFWTNLLLAGVIAPALLLLWRRHGRLPTSGPGLLMLAGFLLGSSPLWWHNLQQDWGTLAFSTKERPYSGFLSNLRALLGHSLPVLAGAQMDRSQAWLVAGLSQAALAAWAAAGLVALIAWGRQLAGFLWRRTESGPGALLLLTALSVSAVFCLLGGADMGSHRYLLGLYLVLPLALAWAWAQLGRVAGIGRGLAGLGLGLVLASNLAGAYLTSPWGDPEQRLLHQAQNDQAAQVIAHFQAESVTHVYCPQYWQAPMWTFLAQERVVFVQPCDDRHPPYLAELLRAPDIGLVIHMHEAHLWRRSLEALGATWHEEVVADCLAAFTRIRPPATQPQPLAPDAWQAQAVPQAQGAARAWDYNAATRWSTEESQRPGQRYVLDLGREVAGVCQVLLFYGQVEDRPRLLHLEGSLDGRNWETLLRVKERAAPAWWSAGKPVFTPDTPWEEVRFAPLALRYLRLSQEGEYEHSWWALCEMLVGVQREGEAPVPAQWPAAASWLAEALPPGQRLWAEPGLAAWLPSPLLAAHRPGPRPAWLPEYLLPDYLLPPAKPLALALDQARLPWVQAALEAAGWRVRIRSDHGVVLLEALPPGPGDQTPGTRLAAVPPRGDHLLIHFPSPRPGLLLRAPGRHYLSPHELTLELVKEEGVFSSLPFRPVWPGQLYFSGWLPLAARPYPLRLVLAQPSAGELRLGKRSWAAGPLPDGLELEELNPPPAANN